jgi:hypothetical protein
MDVGERRQRDLVRRHKVTGMSISPCPAEKRYPRQRLPSQHDGVFEYPRGRNVIRCQA